MILIDKAQSLDDVLKKAEAILASFEEPARVGDYELYLTASIGVSHYPIGGRDADTMIRTGLLLQPADSSGRIREMAGTGSE